MIEVEEALRLIAARINPLKSERLSLEDALHRICSEQVRSTIDLPPFIQSAMDGWAVRAADLQDARSGAPIKLKINGEVPAGMKDELPNLAAGEAARVFTGARIPPGADAVVRQELARADAELVEFIAPVKTGRDIRPQGEQLKRGRALVEPGERLDERHLSILSMCGHENIMVRQQPKITLLISGDEVLQPGDALAPGAVYDANTPFLSAWLTRKGYQDFSLAHVVDDPEEVQKTLKRALDESDLVISTGGVSVGDYDFFSEAADRLGLETVFWRVAQRPGKPLLLARREDAVFLGIPGNPGAVFTSCYIYLNYILNRLQGYKAPGLELREGRLAAELKPSPRALSWVGCTWRVDAEGFLTLHPIPGHNLSALYKAEALAYVPAQADPLPKGSRLKWISLK